MDVEPPDPGGGYVTQPHLSLSVNVNANSHLKRSSNTVPLDSSNLAKYLKTLDNPAPAVQLNYSRPEFENKKLKYNIDDRAPFIVHVSKPEPEPRSGTTLHPMEFGRFLFKNNFENVSMDGVKKIGRNRVSVEFKTAADANSFIDSSVLLEAGFSAAIPSYSVSRMGLVRNVPVQWSMEELVQNLKVPTGFGEVIRARRLSRKSVSESNTTVWIPTQTIVLTFSGQKLPTHVYAFYTSLPIETYILPTIQCNRCCRFGHIKTVCRSSPRCFKCSQAHEGDTCVAQSPSCLHCSGSHPANDPKCPEAVRQKEIKIVMSQENISYLEASARFPKARRSFMDATISSHPSFNSPPRVPPSSTVSYKKTVYNTRNRISSPPPGYDKLAHQSIVQTPSTVFPNGCAIMNNEQPPNDNLIDQLTNLLLNMLSRFNDTNLPYNLRGNLTQLSNLIKNFNNGPEADHAVELS